LIDRLYWAAKTYFSSYGVAWFDLELFLKILRYVGLKGQITDRELSKFIYEQAGVKFARTGREGYYFAKLLRYLELATIVKKRRVYEMKLTSYGHYILNEIGKASNQRRVVDVVRNVFLEWYPLQVFLKFVYVKGRVSWRDVVKDLGGTMRKWTKTLYEIGIAKEIMRKPGVAKPFNSFVVRNMFIPLAKQLNLVNHENGKLSINPEIKNTLAKYFAEKEYDIIKTMPGEYTIYSAIADIYVDAETTVIISPWINSTIVNLIEKTQKINSKLNQITIVTRKTANNIKYIKQLLKTPIKINTYYYNKLHAKITINPEGPATISSANLVKTSLLKNYEIGIYYTKTPKQITTATEEIINTSNKLFM